MALSRFPTRPCARPEVHQPGHVLGIHHADDVLGTALRVVDRNPRILLLHDAGIRFLHQQVSREREDPAPRGHHLARHHLVQLDGAMDDLLLKGRQQTHPPGCGRNQLQLLWRMHRRLLVHWRVEGPQNRPRGMIHKTDYGPRQPDENIHRSGDGKGDLVDPLQSQRLRHQFAKQHMQVRDQRERQRDRHEIRVKPDMGHSAKPAHERLRYPLLADPAKGETGQRDAKLHRRQKLVQRMLQPHRRPRVRPSQRDQLLQTRLAHAHQREFRGHEKAVGQDQKHHPNRAE